MHIYFEHDGSVGNKFVPIPVPIIDFILRQKYAHLEDRCCLSDLHRRLSSNLHSWNEKDHLKFAIKRDFIQTDNAGLCHRDLPMPIRTLIIKYGPKKI